MIVPATLATAVVAATAGRASAAAVLTAAVPSARADVLTSSDLTACVTLKPGRFCAPALDASPSIQMPMTADATRPPNSFTTLVLPFSGGRNSRWRRQSALHSLQRGIARLALGPGVTALQAHSLSFADTQICNRLTVANPPIGEPCRRRDRIWNYFKLLSFLTIHSDFWLRPPLLST